MCHPTDSILMLSMSFKFTIMYKNFADYWIAKREVLEKLGVSREVAKMIWCDAADCLGMELILKALSK